MGLLSKGYYISRLIAKCIVKFPVLILYILSGFVPKNDKIIVFGCWRGEKFRGNSKLLFNYFLSHKKNLDIYWVTKNKNVLTRLIQDKTPVVYAYSLKGFYLTTRAKILVVTHGIQDVNEYVSRRCIMINLGHSTFSIKDMKLPMPGKFFEKVDLLSSNPFGYLVKPDFAITSSNYTQRATMYQYGLIKEKIPITGVPKSDVHFTRFKTATIAKKSCAWKILFLPTWRENTNFNLFSHSFDKEELDCFLRNIDGEMYINFHPTTKILNEGKYSTNRIFINKLEGKDINDNLHQYDCLITDYSAAFADFLVYEKPIIFANFSHADYLKENKLFYDYQELPGPKAANWDDVIKFLKLIFQENTDAYQQERKRMKNLIYEKFDGKACERISEFILSLNDSTAK